MAVPLVLGAALGSAVGGALSAGTGAIVQKTISGKQRKAFEQQLQSDLGKRSRGELVSDAEQKAIQAQIAQGQQKIAQQAGTLQQNVAEQALATGGGGGLGAVTGRAAELIRELGTGAGEQAAQLGGKFISTVAALGEGRSGEVMARFERHTERMMDWGAQLAGMSVQGAQEGAEMGVSYAMSQMPPPPDGTDLTDVPAPGAATADATTLPV